MSREDAIDDLLQRLELTARLAAALELDFAVYLLNVTMLEVVERGTDNPPGPHG